MLFWREQQWELLQGIIKSRIDWSEQTLNNLWLTNTLVSEPKVLILFIWKLAIEYDPNSVPTIGHKSC